MHSVVVDSSGPCSMVTLEFLEVSQESLWSGAVSSRM